MSAILAQVTRECYEQLRALEDLVRGQTLDPLAEVAVDLARKILKDEADRTMIERLDQITKDNERKKKRA